MKIIYKISSACLAIGSIFLLNGCFLVDQVHDKIYEDCYIHPDHIKSMPDEEYSQLAKLCGWNPNRIK